MRGSNCAEVLAICSHHFQVSGSCEWQQVTRSSHGSSVHHKYPCHSLMVEETAQGRRHHKCHTKKQTAIINFLKLLFIFDVLSSMANQVNIGRMF